MFTAHELIEYLDAPETYGSVAIQFVWRRSEFMDGGLQSFIELLKQENQK